MENKVDEMTTRFASFIPDNIVEIIGGYAFSILMAL